MAISDSRADTPQHKPSGHSPRSLAASWLTRERQPALAGLVMCRGRYARSDGSQGRLDGVTGKGPAQEPVPWAVIWGYSDGQGWGPWLTISHPVGSCFHRVLHRTYSHSYPQGLRDFSQPWGATYPLLERRCLPLLSAAARSIAECSPGVSGFGRLGMPIWADEPQHSTEN